MPEGIKDFADGLSLFLNVLELVALVLSLFTAGFIIRNQYAYSKALKTVLAPEGIRRRTQFKAYFLCRKSPVHKRAFIEFAILKTKGHSVLMSEWNTILNEFKSFISRNLDDLIYYIPNCMALTGEEFSEACKRYFDFFGTEKIRKSFGIQEDLLHWVIQIKITEAYIMPSCLLTGLLAQYEENWADFIQTYVSTAYMTESEKNTSRLVLTDELYFTFAWLLWGPSYELEYRRNWGGLCQLSFGDESNSLPAVVVPAKRSELSEKFDMSIGDRYGELMTAYLSVYENKKYYKKLRDEIPPDHRYFYEKIEDGDVSFALQIDDYELCNNYKKYKYYCTAYVWLLFELEDDETYAFRPETSLAFFEHANLTDMYTYTFLVDMLLNKSISHFEKIFSKDEFAERKYRFVCAMNSDIEDKFRKRYEERMKKDDYLGREFKKRIISEPKRKPAEAFMAYDEFFDKTLPEEYLEVSLKNKESVSLLGQFYTDVYLDCFPDKDERESFDNILHYLEEGEKATDYSYHVLLMKNASGEVVGGCIFDYFREINAGVVEFIAVKKNQQSAGLGTKLYNHVLSVMEGEAHKIHKKKVRYVFCEIENPEKNDRNQEKIYLEFWNKLNYYHIDFDYLQPALSVNQSEVDGLWLMVSSMNKDVTTDDKNGEMRIESQLVKKFIYCYMKYAMSIPVPENNIAFKKMADDIDSKEYLGIKRIKE